MSRHVTVAEAADVVTGAKGLRCIMDHCVVTLAPRYFGKGGSVVPTISLFHDYEDGSCLVPLQVARKICPGRVVRAPPPRDCPKIVRAPRASQVGAIEQAAKHLEETRGVSLCCDTGTGKTFMSLYLGLVRGLRIAVVTPDVSGATLWAEEASNIVADFKDQICLMGSAQQKKKGNPYGGTPENARILVVRAGLLERLVPGVLDRYEFVIMDETHLLGTQANLMGVLGFTKAEYIVGCSATPNKPDRRELAVRLLVGERVVRLENHKKTMFAIADVGVETCELRYQRALAAGKDLALVEYGAIERTLALDGPASGRIAEIAGRLASRGDMVLVISKFVSQCEDIAQALRSAGTRADTYTGSQPENRAIPEHPGKLYKFDGYADVLVGTPQMTMTGFDQGNSGVPYRRRINAVILCQSVAQTGNLKQAIGRLMRSDDEDDRTFVLIKYGRMSIHKNQMDEILEEVRKTGHEIDKIESVGALNGLFPYDPAVVPLNNVVGQQSTTSPSTA